MGFLSWELPGVLKTTRLYPKMSEDVMGVARTFKDDTTTPEDF